jgi:arylsulfatase
VQVFHWVDADLAVMLVVLALGGTWVIMIWIPRWVKRWPAMLQRRLVLAWSWLIGLCVLGSFLGELYSGTDGRQFTRAAILYTRSRDNTSGPLAHFLADLQKHFGGRAEERFKSEEIRIIQRPIISMEKYVAAARPTQRWNVIIVIVESLRADQLRAYGATRDIMPTVDALTRESRVFSNAYTHSSHTDYATVTPLSSHYPLRSETAHTYPENPSYPRVLIYDVLKALKYHTAIFSSSNEYWGGMIHFLQTGNLDRFFHAANFKGPTYVAQGDAGFAEWTRETKHAGSVDDRYTTSAAIEWIESLRREPFFMALNFQSSHLPYLVPHDFPRRFGPAKLDFTIRFAHFPREKSEVVKDIYADSLAYVDAQIARLFEYLKSKGIWDNTVIVLTGDHGQAFYEHGFASHASAIFNEVMKVPIIIRAPGVKPGIEDRLAQHVDIAPSILGSLGLPVHPSFQGIDLLNSVPDPKRSAYMVAQTPLAYQYGIVRSGFKLIYDERERRYLLYDLAADPGERADMAASQPQRVNELAKRLQTWRTLQIEYYSDKALHSREYPPILAD